MGDGMENDLFYDSFYLRNDKNHSLSQLSPISIQWIDESTIEFVGLTCGSHKLNDRFANGMDKRWDEKKKKKKKFSISSFTHIH
jgi:hypothetical protein